VINTPEKFRIGVDLGGTKIEAAAINAGGDIAARRRIASPRDDYRATVSAVAGLVAAIEEDIAGRGSVGVAIPGAISPATGLIKNANSTWLIGEAFDTDLAAAMGRPVRLANDANCFALSEAVDGAAAGADVVFGVIIGTGVGGGLVVNQRVIAGANAIAGEWGHNPLPWPEDGEWPGPDCYCGQRGCIETFVSGPALARDHLGVTGEDHSAEQIAADMAAGDAKAEASFQRYERRLARSLATIVNMLDPDVIVLGGGVSNVARIYRSVPPIIAEYTFSDEVKLQLKGNVHGDSSGVRGAAWLWSDEEWPQALSL